MMAFMQPEILLAIWVQIDGSHGITFLPGEVDSDLARALGEKHISDERMNELVEEAAPYYEGSIDSLEVVFGYGARMQAPGYMDCTEWSVFSTRTQAEAYLRDNYLDDEPEEEE
jgi:hypothetical protein